MSNLHTLSKIGSFKPFYTFEFEEVKTHKELIKDVFFCYEILGKKIRVTLPKDPTIKDVIKAIENVKNPILATLRP